MLTIATATPLDCPPVGAVTRLHVAKKRTTASNCARRRAHVRYERAVSRVRANAGWLGVNSDDISRRLLRRGRGHLRQMTYGWAQTTALACTRVPRAVILSGSRNEDPR